MKNFPYLPGDQFEVVDNGLYDEWYLGQIMTVIDSSKECCHGLAAYANGRYGKVCFSPDQIQPYPLLEVPDFQLLSEEPDK